MPRTEGEASRGGVAAKAQRPERAEPFVKWAGGKGAALAVLRPYVPPRFGAYFEPFLGGGALFFATSPRVAVLSDLNSDLVNAYKVVQTRVNELVVELSKWSSNYQRTPKKTFDLAKQVLNSGAGDDVRRASAFIVLNRTCYNGLYRVNASGKFNVPWGGERRVRIVDPRGLEAAAHALSTTLVRRLDFQDALSLVEEGDFVYLDPPYHPKSPTANFTSYTPMAFGRDSQIQLALSLAKLDASTDCHILLSSSRVPFLENLYRDLGFQVDVVSGPRRISSDPRTRGNVDELIVSNSRLTE